MKDKSRTIYMLATISILLTMISFAVALTSTQVLMKEIIKEFSLLGANQGMTNSCFNFGSLIAVISIPFLKGRIAKWFVLAASVLLMAFSMFFIGNSPFFFLVLIFCLFAGTFGGWIDGYTNAMTMDLHKQNSAKYISFVQGSYALGAMLTPIIIHFLMLKLDWRDTYTILSLLVFLAALQCMAVSRICSDKIKTDAVTEKRLTVREVKNFAGDKYNFLLIVACLFYSAAQTGQVSWMVRYMDVAYPDSGIWIQATVSLYWFGIFLTRMFSPLLKVNPLKMIIFGMSASAIMHSIGIFSGQLIIFIILTILCGICIGMVMPVLINESLSRYRGNTSLALSGMYIASKVGMVAMPAIMGTFAAYSLNFSMILTDISFVICAITVFAALSVKKEGIIKRIWSSLHA
jgi:FHS family glucose/mannose:H+ symporter-like MFS transporter